MVASGKNTYSVRDGSPAERALSQVIVRAASFAEAEMSTGEEDDGLFPLLANDAESLFLLQFNAGEEQCGLARLDVFQGNLEDAVELRAGFKRNAG